MNTANRFARAFLAAAAIAAITAVPQLRAQAPVAATAQSAQPGSLFIKIIDGEGALNDIRARTAREPIVEVDDQNHKPVAGALVLFSLDKSGSSYASFAGMPSVSVETDTAGRAVGTGFQITGRKGTYNIRVQAKYGALIAMSAILESNVDVVASDNGASTAARGISHKKIWIVSSVLAAGAIAGIIIASQQSSPATIAAGTGTVGAPAVNHAGIHFQLHLPHR